MLQEFTGRPADVLQQNEDSAHGGDGWVPREGSRLDELGTIWEPFGVKAEWYPLRTVLTHRPGWEIDDVPDYRAALWLSPIDAAKARDQLRAENDKTVARLYGISDTEFVHLLRSFKGMATKRPEYLALLI